MAHCLPLLIVDERRGDNGDATSDPYEAFSPARRAVRKTCADKTAASRGDRSRAPDPRSACHSVTRVTTVESTARPVSGWLYGRSQGCRKSCDGRIARQRRSCRHHGDDDEDHGSDEWQPGSRT